MEALRAWQGADCTGLWQSGPAATHTAGDLGSVSGVSYSRGGLQLKVQCQIFLLSRTLWVGK